MPTGCCWSLTAIRFCVAWQRRTFLSTIGWRPLPPTSPFEYEPSQQSFESHRATPCCAPCAVLGRRRASKGDVQARVQPQPAQYDRLSLLPSLVSMRTQSTPCSLLLFSVDHVALCWNGSRLCSSDTAGRIAMWNLNHGTALFAWWSSIVPLSALDSDPGLSPVSRAVSQTCEAKTILSGHDKAAVSLTSIPGANPRLQAAFWLLRSFVLVQRSMRCVRGRWTPRSASGTTQPPSTREIPMPVVLSPRTD